MTIPNVVLGELIDPVTFGNAVVDAVNEHETEIADRLPLSGGTLTGALEVNNALYLAGGDEIARISAQPGAGRQVLSMFASGGSDIYDSPYISMYGKNDSNASNKGSILTYIGGDEKVRVSESLVHVKPDLQVDGTINGTLTFGIAEGIDTADVLERAETATMPAVDDEGVATTDDEVESVTVNEVVTALLAKVKQLEERIEALEA